MGILELLPCPFCGSSDLECLNDGYNCTIACLDCHAEGPPMPTEPVAAAAWNQRPAGGPSPPQAKEDL